MNYTVQDARASHLCHKTWLQPGCEQAADDWGVRLAPWAPSTPRDDMSSFSGSAHRTEISQPFSQMLICSHWFETISTHLNPVTNASDARRLCWIQLLCVCVCVMLCYWTRYSESNVKTLHLTSPLKRTGINCVSIFSAKCFKWPCAHSSRCTVRQPLCFPVETQTHSGSTGHHKGIFAWLKVQEHFSGNSQLTSFLMSQCFPSLGKNPVC